MSKKVISTIVVIALLVGVVATSYFVYPNLAQGMMKKLKQVETTINEEFKVEKKDEKLIQKKDEVDAKKAEVEKKANEVDAKKADVERKI